MAALATARTSDGENLSCSLVVRDKVTGCTENASLCILMRMVPQGSNHLGTGLKKILDVLGEGIGFFTLDIDCPKDTVARLVEDGNDHFGARGAKRSQVAGIGGDVAHIHDLFLRNGCTRQPLGKREGGVFRRAGPAPANVPTNPAA